jgi:hypothetical protein
MTRPSLLKWAEHITFMGETRNTYKILVENTNGMNT